MKTNDEYTGGSTTYYQVDITHPLNEQAQPYTAECQDIIDALGMTFNEGNAFKALWRRCAARTLGKSKRGYTDGLYDAEKVVFYGERLVQLEQLQRKADGVEQGKLPLAKGAAWMQHNGSKVCPVPAGTLIDVRYSDNDEAYGLPALEVTDILTRNGETCGSTVWETAGTNWITHWRPHLPA